MTADEDTQADAVKARVETWLREKGVRLELDVAQAFRRHLGAQAVDHARYYLDRHTGKVREVDVVAQCHGTYGWNASGSVVTWFVVECKSRRDDPWVLYRSNSVSDFIANDSRNLIRETLRHVERGVSINDLDWGTVLDAKGAVSAEGDYGYQIDDLGKRTGKDSDVRPAFNAVQQVLSAVDGATADVRDEPGTPALVVMVPVVVTAALLYTVDPAPHGYEVRAARWVPLIGRFRQAADLNMVWIVQADSVDDYVDKAVSGAHAIRAVRTTI